MDSPKFCLQNFWSLKMEIKWKEFEFCSYTSACVCGCLQISCVSSVSMVCESSICMFSTTYPRGISCISRRNMPRNLQNIATKLNWKQTKVIYPQTGHSKHTRNKKRNWRKTTNKYKNSSNFPIIKYIQTSAFFSSQFFNLLRIYVQ